MPFFSLHWLEGNITMSCSLEVCFRIEHGKASSFHRSSMKRDKSGYLPFMGKLHKDSAITIQ